MPLAVKDNNQRWSYADYLTWPDDERWEIIEGVAYPWQDTEAMSPAPTKSHQLVAGNLFRQIAVHLHGKQCKVFFSPFDVRLSERSAVSDNYVETVVQPDLLVVCDKTKLDERGCNGSPDLVIEILSPATGGKDFTIKFDLYQKHGVKEYWIIHPAEQTLLVYKLEASGKYGVPGRYGLEDTVAVELLGDLTVDLADVFTE